MSAPPPSPHLCEGPRQLAELLDAEFFGAGGVADVGAVQERVGFDGQGLQRLAQHLAALAESGGRDFLQIRQIGGRQRLAARLQAHNR